MVSADIIFLLLFTPCSMNPPEGPVLAAVGVTAATGTIMVAWSPWCTCALKILKTVYSYTASNSSIANSCEL